MLNYRTTIMLTIICLSGVLIADWFYSVPVWIYIGIGFIGLFSLVYGSASIRSHFYIQALCSAQTGEKRIALSFDDGPDPEVTPAVLDLLREHQIQAAFFCVGEQVRKHPDLIKRMDEEGHLLGNHSFSHHFLFDLFPRKKIKRELEQTGDLIHAVTGKKVRLFRPPYGVTNPPLARAVKSMGYTVIGWSLKSKDTVLHQEEVLLERLKKKLKAGDVVLFHDKGSHLVPVLRDFIQYAVSNHFHIVRVDQLLNIQAYA